MLRTALLSLAAAAVGLSAPSAAQAVPPAGDLRPGTVVETLGGQEVALNIADASGLEPSTLVVPASPSRPLILYCGGTNFSDARFGRYVREALLPYGDVVTWDYPLSGGGTNPLAAVAGAEGVVSDLALWAEAHSADRPLLVWGHSLGGFVGAQVAARTAAVDAVVLETTAPFAVPALERQVARHGVELPRAARMLLPLLSRYDIPAALAGFGGEVLVLGAENDRVLPVAFSRELASALDATLDGARYRELPGANHFNSLAQPATHRALRDVLGDLGVALRQP